jgi:acetyl-CoA C-acetyltransferase
MKDVVILSAVRTPIGAFLGMFKDVPAPKLAAPCIEEAVRRSGVPADGVDKCIMGCVLPAGLGQAPARQAALFAGLAQSVRCTTVNKVCGSGLEAVIMAAHSIQSGEADVVVAGGMESMSRAPFLLDRAREGYRLGHGAVIDSMIRDGLWDVYHDYHMGNAAELCARERKIDRTLQDRYALQSYERAQHAVRSGLFRQEIHAISVNDGKKISVHQDDENPFKAKLDRMATLKPAFEKMGTVTAANASSIADGAAVVVVTSADFAKAHGLKPIARIVGAAGHAQAPEWFTTAPVGAIRKVADRARMDLKQIDVFEINEAFSVVALVCLRELEIVEEKVNVRGGAVALGHPIGASGCRILTTLIHILRSEKKSCGVASACIGGGEALAMAVENV